MKPVKLIKTALILIGFALFPSLGYAQDLYNTQTCKERLQGTWKLTSVRKRSGKFTSELEGIILKFEGDTLYWIDAIHEDTLKGRFYGWTELVEVTKSFKDDPYCDDTDDDHDNDCTYTYETRLLQQNYMSADLRSAEQGTIKTVEWNNFTLSGEMIVALHQEERSKYHVTFMKVAK